MYELYVVTDDALSNGRTHMEVAELSCRGGADAIQLRDKNVSDDVFRGYAAEIRGICSEHNALFIVNDRLRIALECGADGAHLGQSDCPVSEARGMVPDGFILGCSVGSVEEAVKAESDGADYVALSPVFDTSSKRDADPGHGLSVLSDIKKAVGIPVIAIGGIDRDNAPSVIEAGADGVAVISAVVSQRDIEGSARELRGIVTSSIGRR